MRLLALLAVYLLSLVFGCHALLQGEAHILAKCLSNYGGLNAANAERLERYKQWSPNYEEVPCFTQCYLSEMFDFYDKVAGFNGQRLRQRFSPALVEACSSQLRLHDQSSDSSCEHAYVGFHCLVSLENDPFVLIESMPNATRAAKSVMKQCLQQVEQEQWSRLADYAKFPVVEPIPCYTRCFISQLQLFDERTRRWRLPAMRQSLGVPQPAAPVSGCAKRRGRNPCANFYEQFTCFVMAAKV
ncbi:Obp83cd [Drosophila busckii]|uniref:Obp83cd n=1 Tax=Drosophila busckii TaxID=30019 RepID=A0A0M4EID9_DROBS|nr:uncharacterized protein LOC108603444 [Drosophila busckii]ALC46421.1 Obp83cd [Drosophila busckii]